LTSQGEVSAQAWRQESYATAWAAGDAWTDLLTVPWRVATELVAHEDSPRLVVDVASGPGGFLASFLKRFPLARGVWSDASEPMLDLARQRLAPYDGRVDFVLADMTSLSGRVPGGADVILTSRATHHLDASGLIDFYRQTARHLAPGGWLINLDHTNAGNQWDERYRAVRPLFNTPGVTAAPSHPHNYPLPSIADHLAGYEEAGITDVDVSWRVFQTCLFAGRTPS
jgi:SAM-dependent methyltransferase